VACLTDTPQFCGMSYTDTLVKYQRTTRGRAVLLAVYVSLSFFASLSHCTLSLSLLCPSLTLLSLCFVSLSPAAASAPTTTWYASPSLSLSLSLSLWSSLFSSLSLSVALSQALSQALSHSLSLSSVALRPAQTPATSNPGRPRPPTPSIHKVSIMAFIG